MYWRETPASAGGDIDPERELELRLAAQAQAGAAWALSALVARYQPPVVRYLVRLTGNPELAHALAEQVFVHMGKRLRGPQGGQHLRLWLLRAATEVGLDALRRPGRIAPRRLEGPPRPAGLLGGSAGDSTVGRLFSSWGGRARAGEQEHAVPHTQEFVWQSMASGAEADDIEQEQMSPQEAIRRRLMRAVLAELPYGDAQCLALHLVAGLNQSEVASALGVAAPIARRRIVQGLQLFGRRYDAALASLGLQPEPAAEEKPERAELAPFVPAEPIMPTAPQVPASALAAGLEVGESTVPLAEPALASPAAPSGPDMRGPTGLPGEPELSGPTLRLDETEPGEPTAVLSQPDIGGPTARLSEVDVAAPTSPLSEPDIGGPTAPLRGPDRGGPTIPLPMPDLADATAPLPEPELSGPTMRLGEPDLSGPTAPLDPPEAAIEARSMSGVPQSEEAAEPDVSGEPYVEASAFVESTLGEVPELEPGPLDADESILIVSASEPLAEKMLTAEALGDAVYAGEDTFVTGAPQVPEPAAGHAPPASAPLLPVPLAPVRSVPVLARGPEIAAPTPQPPAADAPVEIETEPPVQSAEAPVEAMVEAPHVALPDLEASAGVGSDAPVVVVSSRVVPVLARMLAVDGPPSVRVVPVLAAAKSLPAMHDSPFVVSRSDTERDASDQPVTLSEAALPSALTEAFSGATLSPAGSGVLPEDVTSPAGLMDGPDGPGQDDDVVLVVEAELLPQDDAQDQARRIRIVRVLSADGEAEDPGDDDTPGTVGGRSS